jgi:hypothetical protein
VQEERVDKQDYGLDERIDRVLAKYVSVWLWSILFGTSISLSFSFISYRPADKWGALGFLLAALLIVGFVFAVSSLVYQFYYLKDFLIPTFFPGPDAEAKDVSPEETRVRRDKERSRATYYLKKSVRLMIFAVVLRAVMVLVELIYSALAGYFSTGSLF